MPAGKRSTQRVNVSTPLRLHVLDGAEEVGGAVPESLSIAVAALAQSACVLIVALDHAGRVTMYRQSEWLSAGYDQVHRAQ
jgi:hypothetical protein